MAITDEQVKAALEVYWGDDSVLFNKKDMRAALEAAEAAAWRPIAEAPDDRLLLCGTISGRMDIMFKKNAQSMRLTHFRLPEPPK